MVYWDAIASKDSVTEELKGLVNLKPSFHTRTVWIANPFGASHGVVEKTLIPLGIHPFWSLFKLNIHVTTWTTAFQQVVIQLSYVPRSISIAPSAEKSTHNRIILTTILDGDTRLWATHFWHHDLDIIKRTQWRDYPTTAARHGKQTWRKYTLIAQSGRRGMIVNMLSSFCSWDHVSAGVWVDEGVVRNDMGGEAATPVAAFFQDCLFKCRYICGWAKFAFIPWDFRCLNIGCWVMSSSPGESISRRHFHWRSWAIVQDALQGLKVLGNLTARV